MQVVAVETRALPAEWGFGAVFPNRRTHCDHCEYPVFELVACAECGQEYLSAREVFVPGRRTIRSWCRTSKSEDIDEFQLEVDLDDSDGEEDKSDGLSRNRADSSAAKS